VLTPDLDNEYLSTVTILSGLLTALYEVRDTLDHLKITDKQSKRKLSEEEKAMITAMASILRVIFGHLVVATENNNKKKTNILKFDIGSIDTEIKSV